MPNCCTYMYVHDGFLNRKKSIPSQQSKKQIWIDHQTWHHTTQQYGLCVIRIRIYAEAAIKCPKKNWRRYRLVEWKANDRPTDGDFLWEANDGDDHYGGGNIFFILNLKHLNFWLDACSRSAHKKRLLFDAFLAYILCVTQLHQCFYLRYRHLSIIS